MINRVVSCIKSVLLLVVCTIPVHAQVLFDFEQPYFVEEVGIYCKDHAVVKHEGVYHVFYIQSYPPGQGGGMRSEKWFGHVTSSDLRHWERQPNVMSVDVGWAEEWEREAVWAPKIIEDPNSSDWLMYYTGVNEHIAQQTGLASSNDLYSWYRFNGNPVYYPRSWASWDISQWSNCRDPEIFHADGDENYYLLNTTETSDGFGAISYATSTTLSTWQDMGALFVNDSSNVMESCQLVFRNGIYHLFFTEEGEQGISHIASPTLVGGFLKENRRYVDYAHASEITEMPGDEPDLFSRHSAEASVAGATYYLRFDRINFDTADDVPELISLDGLQDCWSIVFGNAFGQQPTWGDNPFERNGIHSNIEGNSYLSTYEAFPDPTYFPMGRIQGNVPTGMMRSTSFTVTGDRMSLLVGGGNKPGLCFVALVRSRDNRVMLWETGNDALGMEPRLWNLESLQGETMYVIIADLSSDVWGNIATDTIKEYDFSGSDPIPPSDPYEGPLLAQVLVDAGFDPVGVPEQPSDLHSARLLMPYPNPFNPKTRLRYELDQPGHVDLIVVDALGRRVRELHSGPLDSGPGYFVWDGRNDSGDPQASGVYFAMMSFEQKEASSRKLVLVQ
ncbi:MAG: family 43 glycosylhydrolase [bacterium]|nr:family 43 glycosylhydrolase [bacterium]